MDQADSYLQPNETVNSDHPRVLEFVKQNSNLTASPRHRVIELYRAVRDQIYYDPYQITLTAQGLSASTTLKNKYGWCIPKAALLAACCRAINVPAALGYADVRNHLTTDRLKKRMQTDIFYWHGYTSIFLNNIWVKATPAFNASLCEKINLQPLEFDGLTDSIYHPFDSDGRKYMEYLHDRGTYATIPIKQIRHTFQAAYPNVTTPIKDANFTTDLGNVPTPTAFHPEAGGNSFPLFPPENPAITKSTPDQNKK